MKLFKITINSSYGREFLALARSEKEAAEKVTEKYNFIVLKIQEVKP